jgi:hypothetical protein
VELPGKRARESCCAVSLPRREVRAPPSSLPVVDIYARGRKVKALVDSGCITTLLSARMAGDQAGNEERLVTVDGGEINVRRTRDTELKIGGVTLNVKTLVIERIMEDFDVILGLDVINKLGGATIAHGRVRFVDERANGEVNSEDVEDEEEEFVGSEDVISGIGDITSDSEDVIGGKEEATEDCEGEVEKEREEDGDDEEDMDKDDEEDKDDDDEEEIRDEESEDEDRDKDDEEDGGEEGENDEDNVDDDDYEEEEDAKGENVEDVEKKGKIKRKKAGTYDWRKRKKAGTYDWRKKKKY